MLGNHYTTAQKSCEILKIKYLYNCSILRIEHSFLSKKKIYVCIYTYEKQHFITKKECFITLKDHKQNFDNNLTSRLINPAKSGIGIVSKKIHERINNKILSAAGVMQWRNSDSVVEWFKNIDNKSSHSFINFDVVGFHPSITDELLNKAITFASEYDQIAAKNRRIIIRAKNSLPFSETEAWCKKDSSSNFDVTMGSFNGAETCELVGSYLLSHLPATYRNDIGLYRDDGLSAFNVPPGEIEKIKRKSARYSTTTSSS